MYIKKENLHDGWYFCEGRCPELCYWNGKRERFHALECTMGGMFEADHLIHWDDDNKYGTVRPLFRIDELIKEKHAE